MEKRRNRQIFLAQNFLKSRKVVRRLVDKAEFSKTDIVYEIGAGRGIITAELARAAARVIAIEKDPRLVRQLRLRFCAQNRVQIVEQDFLKHRIEERDYKVFASIPFNLTAQIVRKILYEKPSRTEAYLI